MLGPEAFYREMSPQLAARIRQIWAMQGHDLDRIWGQTIRTLPGFRPLQAPDRPAADSRAHDGLCLFDQALIWLTGLHRAAGVGRQVDGLRLSHDQLCALHLLTGRMIETVAGLRQLVLSGLAVPALQLARSVSEDVDMVLALLLRRKLAQAFVTCRSADEAHDFWRRHIAGGRAFRLVAEKLYSIGLDHSDQSEYGHWRRAVLTLLGSAVHSSPLGRGRQTAAPLWPDDPVARDALDFVTHRLHELCAWAHLIDIGLAEDLAQIALAGAEEAPLLAYAAAARDIIFDQMRCALVSRASETDTGPASALPG
ncbi:hypothetical protein [Gemmobacter serpentinus]|uniref:hypothetical protein n=1 Tax=Gemmobacter serpentinus TaxID=2652247 RepID=UPI00124BF10C|nr:hypothetical protein [Gemmobacter serpentinus]